MNNEFYSFIFNGKNKKEDIVLRITKCFERHFESNILNNLIYLIKLKIVNLK